MIPKTFVTRTELARAVNAGAPAAVVADARALYTASRLKEQILAALARSPIHPDDRTRCRGHLPRRVVAVADHQRSPPDRRQRGSNLPPDRPTQQSRHACIQNLRSGHYELAVDAAPLLRLATAFDELRAI